MRIEQALYQILSADGDVSSLAPGGIWTPVLKQSVEYPAIAFRLVTREHISQLANRGSVGLASSRFRVFSAAKGTDNTPAKDLDEAVRLAIQGYRGAVTTDESLTLADGETLLLVDDDELELSALGTVYIQLIEPLSTFDFYDDATQTHQVISDFDVWASEQQPT